MLMDSFGKFNALIENMNQKMESLEQNVTQLKIQNT